MKTTAEEVRNMFTQQGFQPGTPGHPWVPEIDANYVWRRELVAEVLMFFVLGFPALKLMGYQGSGKTSLVEQIHAVMDWPLLKVTAGPRMEAAQLFTNTIPTSDGWKLLDGPATIAAKNGISFLIDEFNVIDPGEGVALNNLVEGKRFNLVETNECIVPGKGFRFFAAANYNDIRKGFLGRNDQDASSDDRFMTIHVPYPEEEDEVAIIRNALNPVFGSAAEQQAKTMVAVANKIRDRFMGKGSPDDALDVTMSTRALWRWASCWTVMRGKPAGVHLSLERAVTNSLGSNPSADAIHNIVQDCFGITRAGNIVSG